MTMRADAAASAGVAAASGAGGVIATVQGVALELFGIPLAVLLAAAVGAFGARVFLAETTFGRALVTGSGWMLAGGWLAELAGALAHRYLENGLPNAAMPAVALVLACLGQRLAPVVWDSSGVLVKSWLDKLGPKPGGDNG